MKLFKCFSLFAALCVLFICGCFGHEEGRYLGPQNQQIETQLPEAQPVTPEERPGELSTPLRIGGAEGEPSEVVTLSRGAEGTSGVMPSPLAGRVESRATIDVPTEWHGLKKVSREEGEAKKVMNDMAVDWTNNINVVGVTHAATGNKIPLWLSFSPAGQKTIINRLDDLREANAEVMGLVVDSYQNYWLFGNISVPSPGTFGRLYAFDYYLQDASDPGFHVVAVSIGGDTAYVAGTKGGSVAVKKYNRDLSVTLYTLPLLAGAVTVTGIAVGINDNNNIYISYNARQVGGGVKAMLGKYTLSRSGGGIFSSTFINEKSEYESANGVIVSDEGGKDYVYVVGSSSRSVRPGILLSGKGDIVVVKFKPHALEGRPVFVKMGGGQWGTAGVDEGMGLALDSDGNIYVAGCSNENEMGGGGSVVVLKFEYDEDLNAIIAVKKTPDNWIGSTDVPACAKKIKANGSDFYVGGQFNEMDDIFVGKLNSDLVPY